MKLKVYVQSVTTGGTPGAVRAFDAESCYTEFEAAAKDICDRGLHSKDKDGEVYYPPHSIIAIRPAKRK